MKPKKCSHLADVINGIAHHTEQVPNYLIFSSSAFIRNDKINFLLKHFDFISCIHLNVTARISS